MPAATAKREEFRVAVIGFGLGGQAFHAPLVAITPGLRLTTIVTSNPERRAHAAREFPQARIVDSAEAVWADARNHDLAVITTANSAHVPLALAALDAGLGVVVDKPFAATVAEGRQVIQRARARGRFLSVYHNRRWDSELRTAKRLIAAGELGDILRFESRLDRWRPVSASKPGWRDRGAPEEAGGLLYDLGSHLIDQALHLFGPVTHVYAEVDRRRPGVDVDDDVFLALTHASGVRSHLAATLVAAQQRPRMAVFGSKAAYMKFHIDSQEAALRAGIRPDQPAWRDEPEEHWGTLGIGPDARPVRSEPGAYRLFYEGVAASLRDGAPPPVDPEDAVKGLEVIEAAQRSSRNHEVVAIGTRAR